MCIFNYAGSVGDWPSIASLDFGASATCDGEERAAIFSSADQKAIFILYISKVKLHLCNNGTSLVQMCKLAMSTTKKKTSNAPKHAPCFVALPGFALA